ncbi:MAG: hypothetical protein SNJ71_08770, partial [Bacteroidales bacterium]
MIKNVIVAVVFLFTFLFAQATHNRAGEITYKHISGYTYKITIVTYTYSKSSANHYRDKLTIQWGDGSESEIPRIKEPELLPDDFQINIYEATHTYPGPGTFTIVMEDPNRNEGVKNIFDSVNIPFTIKTTLKIDPILGVNNTPVLLNIPIDKAAIRQKFIHNPAAYDSDGDSLSYEITQCLGEDGKVVPGYEYPKASNKIYVDERTGDLVWDTPIETGSYNVAMNIYEWRKGIRISKIIRDMQIEVYETENRNPTVTAPDKVCVRAKDTLQFLVEAYDVDGDIIQLEASGGPLTLKPNAAIFTKTTQQQPITTSFTWIPPCTAIRKQPYLMVFKVSDRNKDISLTNETYTNISVIGHPPLQIQA